MYIIQLVCNDSCQIVIFWWHVGVVVETRDVRILRSAHAEFCAELANASRIGRHVQN